MTATTTQETRQLIQRFVQAHEHGDVQGSVGGLPMLCDPPCGHGGGVPVLLSWRSIAVRLYWPVLRPSSSS
jgi:hypothetical protein